MYTVRVTIWNEKGNEELEIQFPCDDLEDIALSLEELGIAIETGVEPFYSARVLTDEEREDLAHVEELYNNGVFDA